MSYVHLQTKMDSAETFQAKYAFEHYAKTHGVHMYHHNIVEQICVDELLGRYDFAKLAVDACSTLVLICRVQ